MQLRDPFHRPSEVHHQDYFQSVTLSAARLPASHWDGPSMSRTPTRPRARYHLAKSIDEDLINHRLDIGTGMVYCEIHLPPNPRDRRTFRRCGGTSRHWCIHVAAAAGEVFSLHCLVVALCSLFYEGPKRQLETYTERGVLRLARRLTRNSRRGPIPPPTTSLLSYRRWGSAATAVRTPRATSQGCGSATRRDVPTLDNCGRCQSPRTLQAVRSRQRDR